MPAPTKPRFSKIGFRTIRDRVDPGARTFQPPVYYFSGGRTKKDPRVPGYARDE